MNTHSIFFPSLVATLVLTGGCFPGGTDDTSADTEAGSDVDSGSDSADGDGDGGPADADTAAPDDADGTGGGTDDGTDDGGTDDGPEPATCGAGSACLGAVAEGWQGPVALIESAAVGDVVPCAGNFPNELPLDLGAGFDAGEAACMCECSAVDPACELNAELSYWDTGPFGLGCDSNPPLGAIVVTDGVNLTPGFAAGAAWVDNPSASWRVDASVQTLVGSCQQTSSASIPEPSFATRITACAMEATPPSCEGDGQCVPVPAAPFDGRVCVWQEGEHECTDSTFSEAFVYHTDFTDDRSCPACTCGSLTGDCSEEHYTPGYYDFVTGGITWDDEQIPLDGTCNGHGLGIGMHSAISAVPGMPENLDCGTPIGADEVQGEAAPADAITFCCAAG